MKRVAALILVLTLLVVTGTIVSADGKTRSKRAKFGTQAQTAALIAGADGVGAIVTGQRN